MRIGARCEVDYVNIVTIGGHDLQWAKIAMQEIKMV